MNFFFRISTLLLLGLGTHLPAFSQCKPAISIDNKLTVVNPADPFGVTFPFWLKEGQTIAPASSVTAISAIEFSVVGTALEFSQVLYITSVSGETVPDGKVWKIEAVIKENNSSQYTKSQFTNPGTFEFKVPGCANQICVEVWGGGGAGGSCANPGTGTITAGGGGGGGYGAECFSVTPGATYSVTVGAGGTGATTGAGQAGGNSSVVGLISASGGGGGAIGITSGGAGGGAGTSNASSNAPGQAGENGTSTFSGAGGAGGNGASGGAGRNTSATGNAGSAVGGGGGGAYNSGNSTPRAGGNGGNGQVIITW